MHTLEYAQECSLRGMLMKQLTNIAGNVWPPRRIEWIIQRYESQMVRNIAWLDLSYVRFYPIVSCVTSLRVYCFVRRVEILLSLPPISNFCSLSEKNSNSSDVPAKLISRESNSIAWNRETLSKCFDQLRI